MAVRPQLRIAVPSATDEGTLWLSWLYRLRWVAIIAQIVTLGFVFPLLADPMLMGAWAAIVVVLAAANRWMAHLLEANEGDIPASTVFLQLALDVSALTGFFYIGGGTANPAS